ncbi:MAG: DNA glycosylase, partial [Actinobacteria bacterium]|nr:DNA glycosylase [Actinomycetota bacterium]
MPEGDTVFRAARTLNKALANEVILAFDARVPQLATADLSGQMIREVVPRGKHILMRTDAGLTLHTHFKMEGSWRLFRPSQKTPGPHHEIRLVITTDPYKAVAYRMPVVELVPTLEEHLVVGHLGPDILGSDWDVDEAERRIRKHPELTIGEAMLDQRNLAGIGNLYKNETLF